MVMQYMLANPPSISPLMDLAKMQAKIDAMGEEEDENFKIYRMVRTGLLAYPADMDQAKGLLILHHVHGTFRKRTLFMWCHTQAVKRATSVEILESIRMVKKSMEIADKGLLENIHEDKRFKNRLEFLKKKYGIFLEKSAS